VQHDVNMVFRVCDRVVGLVQGQVVGEGTPEEMRANPRLIESYLGDTPDDREETQEAAGAARRTVLEGRTDHATSNPPRP
jgi:branched-chain amino acid transport system ATP-binding protein